MPVNKGLLSLVENTPNFSNQALENSVETLKLGWVLKGFQLDSVIASNAVLTTSQKNDLKDDINNVTHLNLGRVLGDLIRHSATIIDATIIPVGDGEPASTFLEILQNVQTIQGLIPELFGTTASEKGRSVNDHLGTLNNIFLTTELDSTAPVFTTLGESINFIVTANLTTETALETAYDNLKNFINGVEADSTDFQELEQCLSKPAIINTQEQAYRDEGENKCTSFIRKFKPYYSTKLHKNTHRQHKFYLLGRGA